jgi:hypothetical protein
MILHNPRWRFGTAAVFAVVGLVCTGVAWAALLTPQPVVTAKGSAQAGRGVILAQ